MSKISDFLYAKAGITIGLDAITDDEEGQTLMAAVLVLAALSDGSASPVETVEITRLISDKFANSDAESIRLLANAAADIAATDSAALITAAKEDLALPYREDLLVMVLHVIAADERKEPGELKFVGDLAVKLGLPSSVLSNVYARYFNERK